MCRALNEAKCNPTGILGTSLRISLLVRSPFRWGTTSESRAGCVRERRLQSQLCQSLCQTWHLFPMHASERNFASCKRRTSITSKKTLFCQTFRSTRRQRIYEGEQLLDGCQSWATLRSGFLPMKHLETQSHLHLLPRCALRDFLSKETKSARIPFSKDLLQALRHLA